MAGFHFFEIMAAVHKKKRNLPWYIHKIMLSIYDLCQQHSNGCNFVVWWHVHYLNYLNIDIEIKTIYIVVFGVIYYHIINYKQLGECYEPQPQILTKNCCRSMQPCFYANSCELLWQCPEEQPPGNRIWAFDRQKKLSFSTNCIAVHTTWGHPGKMSVVSRVGLENNRTSSRGDEEDEYVEQYIMRIDIVLHCLSFFRIIQKYFKDI